MSKIILYTTDSNTATCIREATLDEIMTGARQILSLHGAQRHGVQQPQNHGELPHRPLGTTPLRSLHPDLPRQPQRFIAAEDLFRGTIDGATVHPREVVKEALKHNAAAVIIAHNHPSGVAEPSNADELITRRLKEALSLVDIRVLDHFIVAGGTTTSFAEKGLL